MSDLLIQNATMVLPNTTVVGDLLIEDGEITKILPGGGIESREDVHTIDATGLHLLPGIIDPQVHFRDPGQPEKEDLYTGSCAAASGGVTSFLDMPNNVPSQTTLQSMHEKIATGNRRCVTNFGFFIGATESNVEELQKAVGTPEAPIAIPGICRLHILHLTSGIEADWLNGITSMHGKEGEAHITTEALPQHLTYDERDVERLGTRLKMNPPIRYQKDKQTLWNRLHDGTITCIATDHAPHTLETKAKGFPSAPSGMPGVETSLPVMLTHASRGACTIEQVVKWMSSNVAECYQMIGKGRLEEGYDGDITLVDMTTERMVDDANTWTTVGWSPFHGQKLVGWPTLTVVGGVSVFERNDKTGDKGSILVEEGQTGSPLLMAPWN